MRSAFRWATIILLLAYVLAPQTRAQSSGKKSIHAFLAAEKGGKRTSSFSADAPVIYVVWKGEGLNVGDRIGVVWIAEDVRGDARKDTQIRRADTAIYKQNADGAFSLNRPGDKTWPVGKYRVELSVNGVIAEVAKFTINPGATIEVR